MSTFVATLRARWVAKRAEYIAGKRIPGAIHDGPDGYAKREQRAYRLAEVWARDLSLPGEWWWVQRDQRWDVYPQREPNTLMRRNKVGPWVELFYPDGTQARVGYVMVRKAAVPPVKWTVEARAEGEAL